MLWSINFTDFNSATSNEGDAKGGSAWILLTGFGKLLADMHFINFWASAAWLLRFSHLAFNSKCYSEVKNLSFFLIRYFQHHNCPIHDLVIECFHLQFLVIAIFIANDFAWLWSIAACSGYVKFGTYICMHIAYTRVFIMFVCMWIYFAGVGFWAILATAIITAAKMVVWSYWRASGRNCVCDLRVYILAHKSII